MIKCPRCGSDNISEEYEDYYGKYFIGYICNNCDIIFDYYNEETKDKKKEEDNEME